MPQTVNQLSCCMFNPQSIQIEATSNHSAIQGASNKRTCLNNNDRSN